MSLDQPSPPDPYATANSQQQYNQQAATQQAETNMVNQTTPYGDLTYSQTGTNPDGTPVFSASTTLSPQQQGLLNSTVQTQQGAADTAGNLIKSLGPSLSQAPNLGNDALINTMMGWQQKYMQPIFNQQQSNLNSQLAAQGITQGSTAYDNAQNLQARNVDNAYEGALAQDQGQAFNQAATAYQLPIQTLAALLGEGQPGSVTGSLTSTPTEQIQPANYAGLAEQNYGQENDIYANTMSGLFGLAGNLGKAAMAPSDQRLKKNIKRVGILENGLPVYSFQYKDGAPVTQIGLLAQDVVKSMPEAVRVGDDGFMLVDYDIATRNISEMIDG